jgi:heme-degrading monooxygenase HmoA
VVKVTIEDSDGSEQALKEQVVPRVAEQDGFIAGYWTRSGDDGLSMTVWQTEEAAQAASDMVRSVAPAGVTVDDVEVRAVVANA